jgi:catechol 2,3-dioxygenase-like lactoylglutathione lyase family enzyme
MMSYHHLALAARDMAAIHHFYETIMGFELVKVEIAPIMGGGWGKHFFYRMNGDDSSFIAFWELNDTPGAEAQEYDLNAAAKVPMGTNHYSFAVHSREELDQWRQRWTAHGLDVLEIDHNWCRSIYTRDPNNNMVEYCLTTGNFTGKDRTRALAALTETTMNPSPPPAAMQHWRGATQGC